MKAVNVKPAVLKILVRTAFCPDLYIDVIVFLGYQMSMSLVMLNIPSVLKAPIICSVGGRVGNGVMPTGEYYFLDVLAHVGPPISCCNSLVGLVEACVACKWCCVVAARVVGLRVGGTCFCCSCWI
jgi:hypothetical protein